MANQCFVKIDNKLQASLGYKLCGEVNASSPVVSCCASGDTCTSNGLCHNDKPRTGSTGYYTGGCTDAAFVDSKCPQHCTDLPFNDVAWNNVVRRWACCDLNPDKTPKCDNPKTQMFDGPSSDLITGIWVAGIGKLNNAGAAATISSGSSSSKPTASTSGSNRDTLTNQEQGPLVNFQLPQAPDAPTHAETAKPTSSGSSSLSSSSLTGIGVGLGVAGAVLAGVFVLYMVNRRRRRPKPRARQSFQHVEMSENSKDSLDGGIAESHTFYDPEPSRESLALYINDHTDSRKENVASPVSDKRGSRYSFMAPIELSLSSSLTNIKQPADGLRSQPHERRISRGSLRPRIRPSPHSSQTSLSKQGSSDSLPLALDKGTDRRRSRLSMSQFAEAASPSHAIELASEQDQEKRNSQILMAPLAGNTADQGYKTANYGHSGSLDGRSSDSPTFSNDSLPERRTNRQSILHLSNPYHSGTSPTPSTILPSRQRQFSSDSLTLPEEHSNGNRQSHLPVSPYNVVASPGGSLVSLNSPTEESPGVVQIQLPLERRRSRLSTFLAPVQESSQSRSETTSQSRSVDNFSRPRRSQAMSRVLSMGPARLSKRLSIGVATPYGEDEDVPSPLPIYAPGQRLSQFNPVGSQRLSQYNPDGPVASDTDRRETVRKSTPQLPPLAFS